MITSLKRYLKYRFTNLYSFALNTKENLKIKDNSKTLIYIHIGKCGGVTLGNALKKSSFVQNKFSSVHKIHFRRPPILKNVSYAIVIRNPIKRAISAFNWRYKLVVTDEIQKNRFDGEYEILTKYRTLNSLCEQLYLDEELNSAVSDEFQKIVHLKEGISFYLKPLLDKVSPSQLFAVFATETLDEDIANILSVKNEIYIHQNSQNISANKKYLSEKAYRNLKTFLADDYLYLSKLLTMKNTSSADINLLLQ